MDAGIAKSRAKDKWFIIAGLGIVVLGFAGLMLLAPLDDSRSFTAVRSFSIPSAAMEPTLRAGDYIFGNMRAYERDAPQRGDLVLFKLPRDTSTIWIKRVVGLPDEQIQMRNGILHINGQAVPTVAAGTYTLKVESKEVALKRETLPNGVIVTAIDLLPNGFYDNTPMYQVPPGPYFGRGDNRENSN